MDYDYVQNVHPPKQPATSYFQFRKDFRSTYVLKENEKPKNIDRECAKAWNSMEDHEKEKYDKEYQKHHDAWVKLKDAFKEKYPTYNDDLKAWKQAQKDEVPEDARRSDRVKRNKELDELKRQEEAKIVQSATGKVSRRRRSVKRSSSKSAGKENKGKEEKSKN